MKKILLIIALVLPMVAFAQEQKDQSLPIPATEQAIQMAAQLSSYGYANNDALSLVQAARIVKQENITVVPAEKETEGGVASEGVKKGSISLDADQLLADATAMAGTDGAILDLIEEVKAGVRGAVGGPKVNYTSVNAHGTDVYHIQFRANELAIVTVQGDHDTDLDLYVYDSNGNFIDSDTDYTDNCVCTFTPRWTGTFTIKVVNRGSVYNRYVIRTN